jgi:hypothetical protein
LREEVFVVGARHGERNREGSAADPTACSTRSLLVVRWRLADVLDRATGQAESKGTLLCREFVVRRNLRGAATSGYSRRYL